MYQWRHNDFKGDAEKVAKELKLIEGELTKIKIVAYAKLNPESELHKCFNWDNKSAALYWRYEQATRIMRTLIIVKELNKGPQKMSLQIRAYESVQSKDSQSHNDREYIELESSLSDKYFREQIIKEIVLMIKRAQKKLNKYNMLISECGIINDKIDETIKQIELAI